MSIHSGEFVKSDQRIYENEKNKLHSNMGCVMWKGP